MAELRNFETRSQTGAMIDEGLRAYMLKVYNLMAIGIAITGVAAYGLFSMATVTDASGNLGLTSLGATLYTSPLRWVVIFAPLALVFYLSFRVHKMSVSAAQTTFWVYAALMGASLSSLMLIYTGESIVQTFFVTAASFGALSLYGYTTKRDLSAMGSFMVMGLFGLIIASLVNIFLQSSGLQWAISVLGVVIFAGLTAWDTQKIKEMYYEGDGAEVAGRKAIMGALTLYLDFVNLFVFLLRFMGNSRN
ncbi:Bax inhibitor-1/YccA family protein [Rhizobium sp. L1K21]|uniref:Bax inhibitor-1/YccA family protein n=1 Tax=Rhizobium sp. L1K21 TaxID=2954933 RepID=UPI0020926AEA|nr:Bax inhibitor-1/YccA family protein [Rhizobium sp. L1K21]MCO6184746.1 Bax inhibitor-1/YccA family protein [Rhizobium sp. L1K21]